MEDFEKRKEEYLKKINADEEKLRELKEKIMKTNINPEDKIDVIFNPENDKELRSAECAFDLLMDVMDLIERSDYKEIEKVDCKNSEGVKLIVDAYEKLSNGDESASITVRDDDPEVAAEKTYDIFASFLEGEELFDYLANKYNIDFNNEEESNKFVENISKIINSLKTSMISEPLKISFNKATDEELEKLEKFRDKFHEKCLEGKKEVDPLSRFCYELAKAIVDSYNNLGRTK